MILFQIVCILVVTFLFVFYLLIICHINFVHVLVLVLVLSFNVKFVKKEKKRKEEIDEKWKIVLCGFQFIQIQFLFNKSKKNQKITILFLPAPFSTSQPSTFHCYCRLHSTPLHSQYLNIYIPLRYIIASSLQSLSLTITFLFSIVPMPGAVK